jgi:dipeptidyl aminopeptidase/acylaminoacyl peptidase
MKCFSPKIRTGLLCCALSALTSCARLDHSTNSGLQRELIERSRQGLALAQYQTRPVLQINLLLFDGSSKRLEVACCSRAEAPTISRNRLVVVDMTSSPTLNPLRVSPSDFLQQLRVCGGQVVVMDTRNTVLARSEIRIWPAEVSLSPDERLFAFVSALQGGQQRDQGLYVAGFGKGEARKLMNVTRPTSHDGYQVHTTVDWSPDGKSLVFNGDGAVLLVDLRTGRSRKVADGSAPLWSPSGDWISYVTPDREAALLNVSSGESRRIDPGKKTGTPLEWSPDGKYLLILEGEGSHVPYGCLWVYRVSDGAFVPIPNYYGTGGPRAQWIQL